MISRSLHSVQLEEIIFFHISSDLIACRLKVFLHEDSLENTEESPMLDIDDGVAVVVKLMCY